MRFKVLKFGLDGISGWESNFDKIEDVLRGISYHKGWPSLKKLHAAILKWAEKTTPGDVFCTHTTVVVTVAIDPLDLVDDACHHCGYEEGLDCTDVNPAEGGNLQQGVKCPKCGKRWRNIYTLTAQRDVRCED